MSFISGYSPEDTKRIESHLKALLPYVKVEDMVIVGGIVIRYHLDKLGVKHNLGLTNDLDMILKSPESLSPTVTNDFKISHFHSRKNLKEKFYIVLIHPETKTKMDIFAYDHYAPQETVEVQFEGKILKLRSLEDQLATTMLEISRVLGGKKTYKHFIEHVALLIPLVDLEKTQKYFAAKIGNAEDIKDRTINPKELLTEVKKRVKENPEQLIDAVQDRKERTPYKCSECDFNGDFPITPMDELYKLMGYTE